MSGVEDSQQARLGSRQVSTVAGVAWHGTCHINSSLLLKMERAASSFLLPSGAVLGKTIAKNKWNVRQYHSLAKKANVMLESKNTVCKLCKIAC